VAPTIERIDSGYPSNPMRVLIRLTAAIISIDNLQPRHTHLAP